MNPPNTYAEWAAGCDRLLKGDCDEETLEGMETGSLEWLRITHIFFFDCRKNRY